MEPVESALNSDNIFTAARRIIRNIRVDDEAHGGLLSQATIQASEILARQVELMERQIKALHPTGDRVRITITKETTNANEINPSPQV